MILGYYGGQAEVIDEGDEDWRFDEIPEWIKMPYTDAVEFFKTKLIIPLADLRKVDDLYHTWAFSITGVTRGDYLDATRFLLLQQIETGKDEKVFKRQFKRLLGRRGYRPDAARLKVIYDTNVRGAYGAGREKMMSDPALQESRPWKVWRHGDSVVPRPHHLALHRKAIPADHSFWQGLRLPAGFFCRCRAFLVNERILERFGYEKLENIPHPHAIADKGFRAPFGVTGYTDAERLAYLKTAMPRLNPQTQQLVNSALTLRSQKP